MTTPREEQPAPGGAATPTVSTAPPRSRWRFGNVPSHVGPARTSTVVIGVLFLLLFGLHSYLQSTADSGYTTVTTDTGQQVRVKTSQLSTVPNPAPATTPTTAAPRTTAPAGTTAATRTSEPGTAATTTPTGSGPAAPRSTTTAPSRTTAGVPAPSLPTDTGAPTS